MKVEGGVELYIQGWGSQKSRDESADCLVQQR